ncbi:MAG: RimK/LysX family protein [Planctomycetaceae bacterium]
MSYRPVIVTPICIFGQTWPIELTLSNRDEMGFRMLLGREAMRTRYCVDPGRSYLNGGGPVTDHDRHLLSLRGRRTNKVKRPKPPR